MYSIASFFSGVGGIDLGFEQVVANNPDNGFRTIYANEFDEYPAQTMSLNFPNIQVDIRDIHLVQANEIPNFDVMIAGFPCQAFSIAGHRQGFDDEQGRGELFFELIRIMEHHRPRVAFFENVKNLVGHDNGNTFRVICEQLELLGYRIIHQVMNACQYGNVAQNRERIYIIAFRDQEDYARFRMPLPIPLMTTIHDIIDFNNPVPDNFYYNEDCYFYNDLVREATRHDTTYQWRRVYVRENQSNLIPTLTANMGTGGHNVPIIFTNNNRYRKMTPRECFNAQGFPHDYILPNQANGRLYKQAGNSVVVPVINRIAQNIFTALQEVDNANI